MFNKNESFPCSNDNEQNSFRYSNRIEWNDKFF